MNMINRLNDITTFLLSLYALFTAAISIKKHYAAELTAEGVANKCEEGGYIVDLALTNQITNTLRVIKISVIQPQDGLICPMAGLRNDPNHDIPDIGKLSKTLDLGLLLGLEKGQTLRFFLNSPQMPLSSITIAIENSNMAKQHKRTKTTQVTVTI